MRVSLKISMKNRVHEMSVCYPVKLQLNITARSS